MKALLHGRLMEVNWAKRTAELHRDLDGCVRLRFGPEFDDAMRRLATRYVEIRGKGRITANDQWSTITVEQVEVTHAWGEEFDLEAFLSNPNRRVFDPEKVVRASEPDDVDEFMRMIRESRDA